MSLGVKLASKAEMALLDPTATRTQVENLCSQAKALKVRGVCVNGSRVALAYALLEETEIKVTATIGFPLGASDPDVKRYETEVAIDSGAHELETVLDAGQ